MSAMHVRKPNMPMDGDLLIWSPVAEFAVFYNGASVVIPHVEHYLNNVCNEIKTKRCGDNPALEEELDIFIKQETVHAQMHKKFNQRMYNAGFDELKDLTKQVTEELRTLRKKRSLAFNIAYCAGFETLATFGSQYLYEECDEYFDGADPQGANLILWHVAEEFEHRAVCHDAFEQVSGSYFVRMAGLAFAFWHISTRFNKAAAICERHYFKTLTKEQQKQSTKISKKLFRRQLIYLLPRMLKIIKPNYNPAKLDTPKRIESALKFFQTADPITKKFNLAIDKAA